MDGDFVADVLRAFAACTTGAQLWTLAGGPDYDELLYCDDAFPGALIDLLLDRAMTWTDPRDVADAIALASRITALDAGKVALLRAEEAGYKDETAAALRARRDPLRRLVASAHAVVRSAALHALGGLRFAERSDAELVSQRLGVEDAAHPLAAAALVLGTIVSRLDERARADLMPLAYAGWRVTSRHPDLLVRASTAAGRTLADGAVGDDAAAALVAGIEDAAGLPTSWGWRADATTRDLCVRVLRWAAVRASDRSAFVRALASMRGDAELRDRSEDALFHLAFADGSSVPAAGIARDELDEDQRAAVLAFAEGDDESTEHLRALGIDRRCNVAHFLAGRGGTWRPLVVETAHGPRSWHFVRMWREHLDHGDPTQQAAVAAIMHGLTPKQTLEALAHGHRSRLCNVSRANGDRDVALVVAVVRALAATGFDLVTQIEQRMSDLRRWSEQATALGLLAAHVAGSRTPTAALRARLARGLRFVTEHSDVQPLVQQLDADTRRAILG